MRGCNRTRILSFKQNTLPVELAYLDQVFYNQVFYLFSYNSWFAHFLDRLVKIDAIPNVGSYNSLSVVP